MHKNLLRHDYHKPWIMLENNLAYGIMLHKFRLKEIVGVIVWIFNKLQQILRRFLAHIGPGITDTGKSYMFHIRKIVIVTHKRKVFGNADASFHYFRNDRLGY